MNHDIDIEHNSRRIASLTFVRSPRALNASRTGTGFTLRLPAIFKISSVLGDQPQLMISNLHGEVLLKGDANNIISVGHLRSDTWTTGGVHRAEDSGYQIEREIDLIWAGTLADLALVEQIRAGRQPNLAISLSGEYCFLLPVANQHLRVRTEPQRVYTSSGHIDVMYPREVWDQMLSRLGVAENVLVEIPLPGKSVDARWDVVWIALLKARQDFEQGGTSGWTSCVVNVRRALEEWKKIEGEGIGPADPTQRSQSERLSHLRMALHRCTHLFIHPSEDATRDDALLMLATLSALLAERRP